MPVVLVLLVALLTGGALAVLVLSILAAGKRGPQRFSVDPLTEHLDGYFATSAAWAATATITVPGSAEQLWSRLGSGGYLDAIPFVNGPSRTGDTLEYRATVLALSEHIVHKEPLRGFTAIGTGVSIPLLLKSFGEQWAIEPMTPQSDMTSPSTTDAVTVSWTVAFTPRWVGWLPLRWTAFAVRPLMTFAMKQALR